MRVVTALTNRLGDRPSNQDRCRVVHRGDAVLLALADGMGGHARGEVAAQVLVDRVEAAFQHLALPVTAPAQFLTAACAQAHEAIVAAGLKLPDPVYPRTTVVLCLVQNNRAWWAHVGDSRLYLLRDGGVLARTRDHTYVEDLLRHRAIRETEAAAHPMRNCVTQCLGGPRPAPRPTVAAETSLQFGDVLLLCSDGLWSAVDDQQLGAITASQDLESAVNRLADAAERAGYPNCDNVSVIALRLLAGQEVDLQAGTEAPGPDSECGRDPHRLQDAIDYIRDAIRRYRHELDD